jgi:hypothetical protein
MLLTTTRNWRSPWIRSGQRGRGQGGLAQVVLAFLTYAFVLGPDFHGFDLHASAVVMLACLSPVILTSRPRLPKAMLTTLLLAALVLGYGLILVLLNGAGDLTALKLPGKVVLYVVAAWSLVSLYRLGVDKGTAASRIIRDLILAGLVNVATIFATLLSPSFASYAMKVVELPEAASWWLQASQRSFDIGIGGGDGLGVSLGFLFFLIINRARRAGWPFRLLLASLVVLAAIAITAVTGQVLALAAIAYCFLLACRRPTVTQGAIKACVAGALLLAIIASSSWALTERGYSFAGGADTRAQIANMLSRSFSYITNYLESGYLGNQSTRKIINEMYIYPERSSHFILGDANFGRSDVRPYIPSDVGYVLMVFGSGIVGLLLFLMVILQMLAAAAVRVRPSAPGEMAEAAVFYAGAALVVNAKVLHFGHKTFAAFALVYVGSLVLASTGRRFKRPRVQAAEAPPSRQALGRA